MLVDDIMHHSGFFSLLHNSAPGTPQTHQSSPSRHRTQSPTGRCVPPPLALHSGGRLPLAALWLETLKRDEILAGGLREVEGCVGLYAVSLGPLCLWQTAWGAGIRIGDVKKLLDMLIFVIYTTKSAISRHLDTDILFRLMVEMKKLAEDLAEILDPLVVRMRGPINVCPQFHRQGKLS